MTEKSLTPEPRDFQRPFTELATRDLERQRALATHFYHVATQVLEQIQADVYMPQEDGSMVVLDDPAREMPRFDAAQRDNVIQRGEDLMAQFDEGQGKDYAADVTDWLRRVALWRPDLIPQYFGEYVAADELKNQGSYYPDGRIERFEQELEPVIMYARTLAAQGHTIPDNFRQLEELYKDNLEGHEE